MTSRILILTAAAVRMRHTVSSDLVFRRQSSTNRSCRHATSHLTAAHSAVLFPSTAFAAFTQSTTLFSAFQNYARDAFSAVSTSDQTDAKHSVISLIAINCGIYLMWKICPNSFMIRCVFSQPAKPRVQSSNTPQVTGTLSLHHAVR